jgi:hypothetical protein
MLAALDPPEAVMPLIALIGPILVVAITLWRNRGAPPT